MPSSDSAVLRDGESVWITTYYSTVGRPERPICGHYCPSGPIGSRRCKVFDEPLEETTFQDDGPLSFRLQRCIEAEKAYATKGGW
jgi:hypothetical protein